MDEQRNVVLGAGLTGLSFAYHLNENCVIYEKLSEVGGLARSEEIKGFYFDYAPHILYTIDPYAHDLIHRLLKGNIHVKKRQAFIYHLAYDLYTQFPFQAHLYGLPQEIVLDCLKGLAQVIQDKDRPQPTNYKEWLYYRFGKGIAEHLMIPYSERIWTIDPSGMNFEWIDRRVPEPKFEVILEGALRDSTKLVGFNNDFWYPIYGGIESLPSALAAEVKSDVKLNQRASKINIHNKTVEFNNNEIVKYNRLISTLPLPVMIDLIGGDAPDHVQQAARDLEHNSIVCVNIGVHRPNVSPYHWLYFYEKDFIFHRISFPMNCSEKTTPSEMSSICCEIAYSKHRELPVKGKHNIIQRTINDLIKAKILRQEDEIVVADTLSIKYAYVIYDLNHRRNVKIIHDYLFSHDIYPCGRFGEWEYFNMDHSIMSGKRMADRINQLSEDERKILVSSGDTE
jgi:UDP-galactopyranose mutase